MSEVRFYHLTRQTLEQVLPELLVKTLERGKRAVVQAVSDERVEALAQHLWTFKTESFLPHGTQKDGAPEAQPIWLTTKEERPNNAGFLFLVDGARSAAFSDFERICEIFDGLDASAVAEARKRWVAYKAEGHSLSYWQQAENGWSEQTQGR